ncbi:DUF945 family protein [Marinomonas spartinae]|uniref:DUF945 family protein n=1 Tax=Marinomonas spartinae TaxID=1792290 RepID=UPI0018F13687|nr:DUF945 family protein [Marinomonas spartinae]MBJ7556202.1 DUF945 family protein [Marinomonas spartinae]
MKKLLIALLIAVAAVAVITPKIMGSQYQKQLTDVVNAINATPPYHATIVKSKNGWFGSQTTLQIEVDLKKVDPSLANELKKSDFKSELTLQAHYGPVIMDKGFKLALFSFDGQIQGDDLRNSIKWDKNTPLFSLSGLQTLGGKLTFQDTIAPFTATLPSESKSNVIFGGYQGHGSWANHHLTYDSKLDHASIQDTSTLEVKGLTTTLNFEGDLNDLTSGGLKNSDMTIKMAELRVDPLFTAKGLVFQANSQLNKANQVGNLALKTNINQLDYQDENVSDFSMDVTLNQLNNQFFKDYVAFNQQLDPKNTADRTQAMTHFMHDHIGEFFKTTPELVINNVKGTLPNGKFNAQFDGHLTNPHDKMTFEQLSQPDYWLANANVSTAINADKALVKALAEFAIEDQLADNPNIHSLTTQEYNQLVSHQADVLIKQAMDQGAVVTKDGMYHLDISVKQGKALLNGKPSTLLDGQN